MGATPEGFFRRTFFTYSHDRAIQAVADGVADGAAIDSLVLTYALENDPSLKDRIRVVHTSEPFGIPPVVVPPNLPPRQKAQILDLLLTMNQDAEGRNVLAELGFDRFVIVDDAAYDGVRKLVHAIGAGE
jgi:phosphonate transport system substrate-binding protein